jgi:hypothetical protein
MAAMAVSSIASGMFSISATFVVLMATAVGTCHQISICISAG